MRQILFGAKKIAAIFVMAGLIACLPAAPPDDDNKRSKDNKSKGGKFTVTLVNGAVDKITAAPVLAEENDLIVLTVHEAEGFYLSRLLVTGEKDIPFLLTGEGTYTFTMPAVNVEIDAGFIGSKSDDATLKSLSPSSVGNLEPVFDPSILIYELEVDSSVEAVRFNCEANHIAAKPLINGGNTVALAADETPVEVEVTAQDGSSNIYTVNIIRCPDASLKEVKISAAAGGYAETLILSNYQNEIIPHLPQDDTARELSYTMLFTTNADENADVNIMIKDPNMIGLLKDKTLTASLDRPPGGSTITKEGVIKVAAHKKIAGKPRTADKTYRLVLTRSSDPAYPAAPMAQGGSYQYIKNHAGSYDEVHIFTFTGKEQALVFNTVPNKLNAQIFMVAGGGGGGSKSAESALWTAGGGGAGGLVSVDFVLDQPSYPVIAGAGGAHGIKNAVTNNQRGDNGGDSVFGMPADDLWGKSEAGIRARGGGGGAGSNKTDAVNGPQNGGSGGGGSGETSAAPHTGGKAEPAGGAAQGHDGGAGGVFNGETSNTMSGGGGGAGGSPPAGGIAGGAGRNVADFPALTGVTGIPAGFAGGGGGANNGVAGSATHGGGTRADGGTGHAVPNTGGGGAGGSLAGNPNSGNGASGIVIVRFPWTVR